MAQKRAPSGQFKNPQKQVNIIQVQLDLRHSTGNFWIDNGLVYLVNELGQGTYPVDNILALVQERLLQKTGNVGQYFDEVTGELKNYDKVTWVYPTGFFIKVVDAPPKKKVNGKEYPLSPPHPRLEFLFSKTKKQCNICGAQASATDAKMWMFPFIVAPDKFGSFYSRGKRGINLCPRCAVAGTAGYLTWLWVAQGRTALHFFLFHSDLAEISRLQKEVIQPLALSGSRGGNIVLPFYGPYLHETTMALLLKLFAHVQSSDQIPEEGRMLLASLLGADETLPPAPLTLYAITGNPGQAFNMQLFREFSRLHALYRLYQDWLEVVPAENPQQTLINVFRQFQVREGNQYNTLWREKISWAVLEFDDPLPSVEAFLFEARAKEKNLPPLFQGTEAVLSYYAKEVLHVDENLLKVLKGFGYTLGTEAQKSNEMGLLYALRNAKNLEEFLRVLNDIQFRLEITVPERLVEIGQGERIAGSPWLRVKTLLSIYAMNSYLRAARGSRTEEGGNVYEQPATE
ncbi:conserved hypothetical protein [Candidatus Desulforudis audaxviator MP104C]|uniref:Uncharacterized protein n=1 Tax=Desulforudis audaxviator (strain MP104C) TaxID=477974 RepID=B1I5P3_DESAP|nr:hypothetical protein [Candidatus Desulforudis audaxviator]ACA60312.1 conserved hypothetical protein [Candidatus Desulforudis audaxviator MP104C]